MAVDIHKTFTSAAAACGMASPLLSKERSEARSAPPGDVLRRLAAEKPEFAELGEMAQREVTKEIASRHAAVRTKAIARLETCLDSKDERVAMRAAQLLATGVGIS